MDKPLQPVLVATSTRLLVGSVHRGSIEFSIPAERVGGTSVDRLATGGIRLGIRLIKPAVDVADGSESYSGDFFFLRSNAEALVAVAHGIDKLFHLEEPAAVIGETSANADGFPSEGWFISWINSIESSMTPAGFRGAMGASAPLDATTNGLVMACREVYIACFGMIQANCSPQALELFKAQVANDFLGVTPWGLIQTAVDLDPTNGAARGEWEAAVHEVAQMELGKLRQSIVGSR
ncbi:hypothetical protein GCU67_04670 [Modestobacter muralis]|uniref:Uncharacterized protein n=1 Tax=Modestobacter muralis TaxID=1608614 RepID=A0A6P0H687_9ACTN|nr:hypothetical protein [Modestobacter muralis]NEK93469.1 hypothetical protein [Modestobacter muralis]NEN50236.1 hypothetical protein [Modestobacter muralis]